MSMNHLLVVFFALLAALVASPSLAAATGYGQYEFSKWSSSVPKPLCQGSIAECMASGEEFQMDSESNRRILASTTSIGSGALQANTVPCSKKGTSYYNCQSSGQANPYTRPCNTITKCAR